MMASLPRERVSEPQEKGAFDNEAEPERCHFWLSEKGPSQCLKLDSQQTVLFGGGCGTSKRWDLAGEHRCWGEGAEPFRLLL